MKLYDLSSLRYSSWPEFLDWSLRNNGKIVRTSLLQSSIIPKPFHSSLYRNTFTRITTALNYNSMRLIPYRRNSTSTSTSRSHNPTVSTININDNETKPASNDELSPLINKSKRTKDDIESIRSIILTKPTSIQERREGLEILLKYKKYAWVQDILQGTDLSSFDIRFISTIRQALLGDFQSVGATITTWPKSERLLLLNEGVNFLVNKTERPQKAFLLWSTITAVEYPEMNLISSDDISPYRSSLRSILNVLKDPKDVMDVALKYLSSDGAKSNMCYYLSFSFNKISLKEQSIRVWNLTPMKYRSSLHLSHTLQSLSAFKRNEELVSTFKAHPKLHDIRSRRLTVNALLHLQFYKSGYYKMFFSLIKQEPLSAQQLEYALTTLIYHRKLNQFDQIAEYYTQNGLASEMVKINYQIRRASSKFGISEVIEQVRKISAIKSKPNEATYTLLFQEFAKNGNSNTVITMLNNISQHGTKKLKVKHFALAMEACAKAMDIENSIKVQTMMKQANVTPNHTIIENLMSLHFNLNDFGMVKEVFLNSGISKPTLRMFTILMKALLIRGDFLSANLVYRAIKKRGFRNTSEYYLTQIEFYATQGVFGGAYEVIKEMKHKGMRPGTPHYLALMSSFNRNGRYADALEVFNIIVKEALTADPLVYYQLLVSLTKLDLVNKRNFERPIEVVDEIINAAQNNTLNLKNSLPFISIKPLVDTLVKFYKPDDAYRIMTNFRVINPEFLAERRLNYIKQELLLFSKSGKWGSFAVSFDNFQRRIDSLLNTGGVAPSPLKKVYNSVIKALFKQANLSKELTKFNGYFNKLIFEQRFTFDSNNLNWITSRLVRNKETFHGALYIIEKKLIGGFIAKRLLRFEKVERRFKKERYVHPIRHGQLLKPQIALGYINAEIVRAEIYKYILKESKKRGRDAVINELKSRYPQLMRNLPEISRRLNRRDNFLKQKWEKLGLIDGKRPKGSEPTKIKNT